MRPIKLDFIANQFRTRVSEDITSFVKEQKLSVTIVQINDTVETIVNDSIVQSSFHVMLKKYGLPKRWDIELVREFISEYSDWFGMVEGVC